MDGQWSTPTSIGSESDELTIDLMPVAVAQLEVNKIEVAGDIPEKAGWVRMT